jgi:uncharacterized protein (TIGR00255 family)
MTAYGRAEATSPIGRVIVEIQSLNRKHLEIHTNFPKELARFDPHVRKWVGEQVARGRVGVTVSLVFEGETCPVRIVPNLPLATRIKEAMDAIGEEVGVVPSHELLLQRITTTEGMFTSEQDPAAEKELCSLLHEGVVAALVALDEMRVREGVSLSEDMTERIGKIRNSVTSIEQGQDGATDGYREKLMERLKAVMGSEVEHEERILREVALFAERIDISEELTRLFCHLDQLEETFSRGGAVGKRLDFLLQESMREANTVASKATDISVVHQTVEVKSELEKIREQVQNVE